MDNTKTYDPSYVENIEAGDPSFWQIGAPPYWLNQETGEMDVSMPNSTLIRTGPNHGAQHESGDDVTNDFDNV